LRDLAGGVARQLADEVNVARELERGEPGAQPGAELIGPGHGALGKHQPGRAGLACAQFRDSIATRSPCRTPNPPASAPASRATRDSSSA